MLVKRFLKHLIKGKEGWRHPETCEKIMSMEAEDRHKDYKHVTNGPKHRKSPFQIMEVELHDCVKEHRRKSRKVSKSFIKTQVKKLLKEFQPDKDKIFCASDCWMHRFCKRRT